MEIKTPPQTHGPRIVKIKRDKTVKSDVVIRWPKNESRLNGILKSGRCPSDKVPQNAKKNALVVLVDSNGKVLIRFKLQRIVLDQKIIGANGKPYKKGCELIAKKGSARRPAGNDPQQLTPIAYPDGAIAYFDASTNNSVWYGGAPKPSATTKGPPPSATRSVHVHLVPYHADNTGKVLNQPEAALIAQYREWLGGPDKRFMQGKLKRVLLSIDLFVRGPNLLIEAKSFIDRDTLRMALGQLHDYRHFMKRRPRLAVLVPTRPTPSVLRFLSANRVTCIWSTRAGSFRDSAKGRYSQKLRRLPA